MAVMTMVTLPVVLHLLSLWPAFFVSTLKAIASAGVDINFYPQIIISPGRKSFWCSLVEAKGLIISMETCLVVVSNHNFACTKEHPRIAQLGIESHYHILLLNVALVS